MKTAAVAFIAINAALIMCGFPPSIAAPGLVFAALIIFKRKV